MVENLVEHFVSQEGLLDAHFLKAVRHTVTLPDGSAALREFIVHPGAVMIVPLLDDGRLVMERQFRYPVGRVMLEFPAGKLDSGESPFQCAVRELSEETGYCAAEWARAGQTHPGIGYSTEVIEVWFARGLTLGQRKLDVGEFLDVTLVAADELIAACLDGTVTDAKTMVGAMWLQNVSTGLFVLQWGSLT